ncbi:hypothetical protein GGP41_003255 [Bipolaris sorokiniana]|uniref:Uncharacterized protein n=1 Tax=Cochliobolus sativus TaxID=45130 RepID=A0A8H5ZD05_COCSA|nr:hypothetical protein GGP41_003255 [Bipolaris sorokiniana]
MQSDRDQNGGGGSSGGSGTSRASNAPAASRTSSTTPKLVLKSGFSAPVSHGVPSMLSTATEIGSFDDVLMDGSSGFDNTHRQTQRHRESSRILTASSTFNTPGIHSGQSHDTPRRFPYRDTQPRQSVRSMA